MQTTLILNQLNQSQYHIMSNSSNSTTSAITLAFALAFAFAFSFAFLKGIISESYAFPGGLMIGSDTSAMGIMYVLCALLISKKHTKINNNIAILPSIPTHHQFHRVQQHVQQLLEFILHFNYVRKYAIY